jgi:putative ABC transport system permease protein
MISFESINYSLRNLKKRKARSFLTILSIFVGITSIFLFVSFGLGLYDYVNSFTTSTSADKILISPKGVGTPGMDTTFALTDDDINAVEKAAGVKETTGSYFSVAKITQSDLSKYVYLMSFDPDLPLMLEISIITIQEGRNLQKGDDKKVVLGYNYMLDEKIFPNGYVVGDMIEIQGVKHRIIGFFSPIGNPTDDSNIYVTNDYFLELYPNTTSYSYIVSRVDVEDIDNIVERVEKSLRNSRGLDEGKEDFTVDSFVDLIEQYSAALDIVIGFILLIALISIVVSAINTANTMITSVLERTREIGTMKAVGAKNSEILKIFLFESAFLGFIAGVIGVILGTILSYSTGAVLENLGWGFLSPAFPISLYVGAIAFATLAGAISGVYPAWRASKLKTVDALRYE